MKNYFIVKREVTFGLFSGTKTSRTIVKISNFKKAMKYVKDHMDFADPFSGITYYVWNGNGELGVPSEVKS